MINKEENVFTECGCGCSIIRLQKFDDSDYIIDFLISSYYVEQKSFFYKIKNKFEVLWNILFHGTYIYQEIVLDNKSLDAYINSLNKIRGK
jgi:hypothetical protein